MQHCQWVYEGDSDVGHIQTDIADITADIKEIRSEAKTDFRVIRGAMIVGFPGIAALLAQGFGWL